MPDLPLPSQTDVTIQNQTTGVVDYLKYEGSTLVASRAFDYGLGSDFKVVASDDQPGTGTTILVAQSASTGRVDFLNLDTNGNLVSSAMSSVAVPHIVGFSDDIGGSTSNGTLVSQLPNGELDFLAFNQSTGALSASDLVTNTVGLAHAVRVSAFNSTSPAAFFNVGTTDAV